VIKPSLVFFPKHGVIDCACVMVYPVISH